MKIEKKKKTKVEQNTIKLRCINSYRAKIILGELSFQSLPIANGLSQVRIPANSTSSRKQI